jgi:hypothetical protein
MNPLWFLALCTWFEIKFSVLIGCFGCELKLDKAWYIRKMISHIDSGLCLEKKHYIVELLSTQELFFFFFFAGETFVGSLCKWAGGSSSQNFRLWWLWDALHDACCQSMHQERSNHAASHDTGKELYETVQTVFTGLLDSEDLIS